MRIIIIIILLSNITDKNNLFIFMHLAAKAALVPTVLKSVFYKIIMSPKSSQEIFIMTILHTTLGGFIKVKLLD